jgi:hypothetical protein
MTRVTVATAGDVPCVRARCQARDGVPKDWPVIDSRELSSGDRNDSCCRAGLPSTTWPRTGSDALAALSAAAEAALVECVTHGSLGARDPANANAALLRPWLTPQERSDRGDCLRLTSTKATGEARALASLGSSRCNGRCGRLSLRDAGAANPVAPWRAVVWA